MPKVCANLTWLFTELPMIARPHAAAQAGFGAVEVLFPYDENAADLGNAIAQAGVELALINCPPPNYADPHGPRGFAAVPGEQARFQQAFRRALRYAGALGAQRVHIMAGVAEGAEARQIFIENLRWAAEFAPKQALTIEPINRIDMPGYFLCDYDQAADILREVAVNNLHLQFDAYHAHRITGDVIGTWEKTGHLVRHVQVAGFPGRHEPVGSDIDYKAFFACLRRDGYDGWISGEYTPAGDTGAGLEWLKTC
ncbi:TIM barrel protein [Octadecabacter sp. SW4]|uniref:hydroxypyruvate isomerase family protein n=1 Tax=Octadecabacter sp. SW4 TaxID=2602067 RepID=UPI0011C1DD06|nr:TIM barrel protein [Octadecabacter sp. SW4]QEE34723.1 TIM barrel protein [Octadecabacter sp. SW4]